MRVENSYPNSVISDSTCAETGIPATLTEAEELAAMYYIITGQVPNRKEARHAVEKYRAKLEGRK